MISTVDTFFTHVLLTSNGQRLALNNPMPFANWEQGLIEARRGLDALLDLRTDPTNIVIMVFKHTYLIDEDNVMHQAKEDLVAKVRYTP